MGFKALRQTDLTGCGPACVQMILLHYGCHVSQDYLAERAGATQLGTSAADLNNLLKSCHFQTLAVRTPVAKVPELPLPAILYWRGNHFVVLYKATRNRLTHKTRYHIADPAAGKVSFNEDDFRFNFLDNGGNEGTALLALPTRQLYDTEFPPEPKTWRKVFSEVASAAITDKRRVAVMVALTLAATVCNWFVPVIYKDIIDHGVTGGDLATVWRLFAAQLALFLGYITFTNLNSLLTLKLNYNVTIRYLSGFLRKIAAMPMKRFEAKLPTDMLQRIDDFSRLQTFITKSLPAQLFSALSLVALSVILGIYSIAALAVFYAVSAIAICFNAYFLRQRRHIDYTRQAHASRTHNTLLEMMTGMKDIKAAAAESLHISKWEKSQSELNRLALQTLQIDFKLAASSSTVNKLRDISILALGALMAISGTLTIGQLMSVTYLLGMISAPMERIPGFMLQWQEAKISAERVSRVIDTPAESDSGDTSITTLRKALSLHGVSFKYPGNSSPLVLDGISLTIAAGKTTAIVGDSGSGKTTLIKLLLGLYQPCGGTIEIDSAALAQINPRHWRSLCGAVFQDGYIFSGTVAENITMQEGQPDTERMKQSARMACAHQFISRLPMGYGTRIGKAGIGLSQGQKQRLLIARAFYKDPQILFFDEATSSLDTINEREIMRNIMQHFGTRTLIIAAHRLSTVSAAHQIIVLQNGHVAETGTHAQLIARHGPYWTLVRNQLELPQ